MKKSDIKVGGTYAMGTNSHRATQPYNSTSAFVAVRIVRDDAPVMEPPRFGNSAWRDTGRKGYECEIIDADNAWLDGRKRAVGYKFVIERAAFFWGSLEDWVEKAAQFRAERAEARRESEERAKRDAKRAADLNARQQALGLVDDRGKPLLDFTVYADGSVASTLRVSLDEAITLIEKVETQAS